MSSDFDPAPAEFDPPFGLGHRHAQSILSRLPLRTSLLRREAVALLRASRREILDCGEGVRLAGDFSAQPGESRGLVVMLHGWEGSADSSYMLSAGATAFGCGYDVFRLNFRDHGDTHDLNEELFHSCRIDEVVNAVASVVARHPSDKTMLLGHSLGGNFAIRAALRLGRLGSRIGKVLAICPVLNPYNTMRALEQGMWVYRHYFLRRWRRSLVAKATCFPERYDFGDLRRFPTLTATTDFFVRHYTEYPDLDTYLDGYAITGAALARLDVPTRMILAADDPVIPVGDLKAIARSRALEVNVLPRGSHCAFLDSYSLTSWFDKELARELQRL